MIEREEKEERGGSSGSFKAARREATLLKQPDSSCHPSDLIDAEYIEPKGLSFCPTEAFEVGFGRS